MSELTEVFKYAGELFSRFFRVVKWNVHYWINKKLREIERKRYHPLICECDNFSRLLRDSSCNSEEQINYYVNRWKSILFKISKKEGYGKKRLRFFGKILVSCVIGNICIRQRMKKKEPPATGRMNLLGRFFIAVTNGALNAYFVSNGCSGVGKNLRGY